MEIAALVVRIGANLADLNAGMDKATKAVTGFQATLKAVSDAVAGYFTAEAVLHFVEATMHAADELVNLSHATGISIEEIQRMRGVAEATGSSLEAFTTASQNMTRSFASDAKEVVAAYQDLGLSQQALRGMNQDEAWRTVADALRGVKDQTQLAVDAQAIYGRQSKEILPAIKEGYADLAKGIEVASEAEVKATAAAKAELDSFTRLVNTAAIQALGDFVLVGERLAKIDWQSIKTDAIVALVGAMRGGLPGAIDALAQLQTQTKETMGDVYLKTEKATDAIKEQIDTTADGVAGLKDYLALIEQMNKIFGADTIQQARDYVDVLHLMGDELPKLRDGQAALSQKLVETLGHMIELGQAGTETYRKLREELDKLNNAKPAFDLPSKSLDTRALMGGPADISGQSQTPGLQEDHAKQAQEENWINYWIKSWKDAGESISYVETQLTQLFNNGQISLTTFQKAMGALPEFFQGTLPTAIDTTAKATDTATKQMTSGWQSVANAAAQAGAQIKAAVPQNFDWAGAYRQAGLFVNDISIGLGGNTFGMARSLPTSARGGFSVPGFATGTNGYQDFGSGTLVTLHGKEKVTPWGAGDGGGAVTVNVSGVLLSNNPAAREDLRRFIDDSVSTGIKRSRKFSY